MLRKSLVYGPKNVELKQENMRYNASMTNLMTTRNKSYLHPAFMDHVMLRFFAMVYTGMKKDCSVHYSS